MKDNKIFNKTAGRKVVDAFFEYIETPCDETLDAASNMFRKELRKARAKEIAKLSPRLQELHKI